jgi:hypothetical protein
MMVKEGHSGPQTSLHFCHRSCLLITNRIRVYRDALEKEAESLQNKGYVAYDESNKPKQDHSVTAITPCDSYAIYYHESNAANTDAPRDIKYTNETSN